MSNKLLREMTAIFMFIMAITVTITAYGAENETKLNNDKEETTVVIVNEDTEQQNQEEIIVINTEEPEEETLAKVVLQEIIKPINEDEHVYITNNLYLDEEQKQINAQYVYYYLNKWGWSDNAIFAVLGNMDHESTINPGRWQNGKVNSKILGFGIVQWTPGAKKVIKWANENGYDPNSLYTQLYYLNLEADTEMEWIAHKKYYQSFSEFKYDTEHDVEWLTCSFCKNFERPKHCNFDTRVKEARKWEEYFNQLWQSSQ